MCLVPISQLWCGLVGNEVVVLFSDAIQEEEMKEWTTLPRGERFNPAVQL
jgi:hypothetical protein